jgi:2-dehydro-3-deoxygalactonokinase
VTPTPSLVALDWGTTALRAYLLDDTGATVLEERAAPWGVMHLPDGGFAAAFERVTGEWRTRHPGLPCVAAGMVGSAQGWVQAPYVPCPAGPGELAAALASVSGGALHVVPGVAQQLAPPGERPDVMRGEETQVVGALALHPELAGHSLLVLPGTHSKWVRVEGGRIASFGTFLTGELFAVLRDHSILGRPPRGTGRVPDPEAADAAFARGVAAARGSTQGVAPLLFSARALVLGERLPPDAALEYLSGLLVGDELRCGLAGGGPPLRGGALIGDEGLCARYARALAVLGVAPPLLVAGREAVSAGACRIARDAGLIGAAFPGGSA